MYILYINKVLFVSEHFLIPGISPVCEEIICNIPPLPEHSAMLLPNNSFPIKYAQTFQASQYASYKYIFESNKIIIAPILMYNFNVSENLPVLHIVKACSHFF